MKDDDHRKATAKLGDKAKPAGRLVELMFSGMSHPGTAFTPRAHRAPEEQYQPLRQFKAAPGASFHMLPPRPLADVRPDSPAIDVMTDLSKVAAVTIPTLATIDEANQTISAHRARALSVVDEERA